MVSFSDFVHRKAFTERYEIYLRYTFMSVSKSAVSRVSLLNVFLVLCAWSTLAHLEL